jgi:hypothetical protein
MNGHCPVVAGTSAQRGPITRPDAGCTRAKIKSSMATSASLTASRFMEDSDAARHECGKHLLGMAPGVFPRQGRAVIQHFIHISYAAGKK